ncbi:aspartyl protease family protein [Phenylobacterium sp.]|uniref:aspartyl protease family protein n=1 Tax=Phenylobacterium sp. TaxID=1871053 RepID=UPI002ED89470
MIGRRSLLIGLAAAAGGLFLVRDRLPWPPLAIRFANGRDTPWLAIPPGGLMEIEAAVNGHLIHAVVDSGAQFSAIDRTLAERLDLPRTVAAPLLAYGVSGAPALTHTVRLDLAVPGLAVPGLRAAALDLAPIAQATGRVFQLLIGRDVLSRLVVEADFPRRRTRFLAADAYSPPPDARTVALEVSGAGPMATVQVENAPPLKVLVDTGAAGVLALSENAAQQAGLLAPGRKVSRAHSVSLGGLSLDRRVTARTVAVGDLVLRNVDVQVYRPAANAPAPSGLLGAGLFSRFRMALDLGAERLHLVPPSPMIIR